MKKRILSLIIVILMCFTFGYGCKTPVRGPGKQPVTPGDNGDLDDGGDNGGSVTVQLPLEIKHNNKSVVYSGQAYEPALKFLEKATAEIIEDAGAVKVDYYKDAARLEAAPVDAGSYKLAASVDNKEYIGKVESGFEITRKPLTINIEDQVFEYGTFTAPAYTIVDRPDGLNITVTYDGEAAAPEFGSVRMEIVAQDNNHYGKASAALTINPPEGKFIFNEAGSYTYDGTAKVFTVTGNVAHPDAIAYELSYFDIGNSVTEPLQTAPAAIGSYKVVADVTYQGESVDTIEKLYTINIQPVMIAFSAQDVYFGDAVQYVVENQESLIDADGLDTVITYDGESTPNGYGDKTVAITISNAYCYGTATAMVTYCTAEESFFFEQGAKYTYDGTAKVFSVRGSVRGEFVSEIKYYKEPALVASAPANAGNYGVRANINYNNLSAQISMDYVIEKKNYADGFTVSNADFVFGDPQTSANTPVITAPEGINAGDYTVTYVLQANNTVEQYRPGVPYSPGTYKAIIKASGTYKNANCIIDGEKKFDIKINNAMDGYKFAQFYHENVATKYKRASVADTITGGMGAGTVRVNTDIVKNNNEFLYTTQSQGKKIFGQSVTFAIQTYQKTGEGLYSRRVADSTSNTDGKLTTDFKDTAYTAFTDSNDEGGYAKAYGANPQGFSIYIINETTVNEPNVPVTVAKDDAGLDRAGYVTFTFGLNEGSYANYKIQLIAYAKMGNFRLFNFCNTAVTLDKWGRCEQFNVDEHYTLNAFIDIPTDLDSWETFDYTFNGAVTKP